MLGYLTSEEIDIFYRQGYFIKKQCFNEEEIIELEKQVSIVIKKSFELIQLNEIISSEEDQIKYSDEGTRIVYKHNNNSTSIVRINGCCGMNELLLRYIKSDKIIHTFYEILKTNDIEHIISQIHPKLPFDGISYPKHKDIQYRKSFDSDWNDILGNGSYAICIISIDGMSKANGGLWIDKNNYNQYYNTETTNNDDDNINNENEEEDIIWIETNPGDALFMHPYLYHGSGPNISNYNRRTLLAGYCAYNANHKKYPGALVNTRHFLNQNGTIELSDCSWSINDFEGTTKGH